MQNSKIRAKASEELRFCTDRSVTLERLLACVLNDLQNNGFLNDITNGSSEMFMNQIKSKKDQLRLFILDKLKAKAHDGSSNNGLNFGAINKEVQKAFVNQYKKDLVFKAIDDLFQKGEIYEVSRCTYAYLDNKF